MAPHAIKSAMYCGEIVSRNSVPAGTPMFARSSKQPAGDAQAVVDVEGIVQIRIVDQALPADRGAGFFKIDPHDDEHVVFAADPPPVSVWPRIPVRLPDRGSSRADHRQQAVVLAAQDGIRLGPGAGHQFGGCFGEREIIGQNRWGNERIQAGDSEVVGAVARHAADR